jgi:hypothetical protein
MDLSKEILIAKRKAILKGQQDIISRAEDFRAFYENDYDEIKKIIVRELEGKVFSKETLKKIRIQHMNIIHKPLNRKVAGIIDEEPVRYLEFESEKTTAEDGTEIEVEGEYSKQQNELLERVLVMCDYNLRVKEALKASEFFNIVLSLPVWNEDNIGNELRIDNLLPDDYVPVTKKDYLVLDKISISRVDEKHSYYWLVFTEEENYIIDNMGNEKDIVKEESSNNGVNPYKTAEGKGIIPIAILRKNIGSDFYGEPNWNLYLTALEFDIARTDFRHTETFQHFGIWFAVNTNLPDGYIFSPNKLVQVKSEDPNSVQPTLENVKPQTDFDQLRENLDWLIQTANTLENIPAASSSKDVADISGYSKEIDEGELNETRADALSRLYKYELDLLMKIAIVWNTHNPNEKLDIIKGKFQIDYSQGNPHESVGDKKNRRSMEAEYKIKTPIDFIMEDLEVTEEEARTIYDANKKFYDEKVQQPEQKFSSRAQKILGEK